MPARGLRRDRTGDQPRRGDRRAGQHRRAPGSSPATTTTRRRRPSGCAAGCTGAATSPTATRPASSTTPAAPPTGCASTARTSPPRRSSGSCVRHPSIAEAAVYAVPDPSSGDQLVAALVLVGVARRRRSSRSSCRRSPTSARSSGRGTSGSSTRSPARRPTRCSSGDLTAEGLGSGATLGAGGARHGVPDLALPDEPRCRLHGGLLLRGARDDRRTGAVADHAVGAPGQRRRGARRARRRVSSCSAWPPSSRASGAS